MRRWLQYSFGAAIAFFVIGAPLAYALQLQSNVRRFHVVEEGVLYRSGELSPGNLRRIVREYRIKTVVSLRAALHPGALPPDHDEEVFCAKEEIRFFRIPQKAWDAENGAVPDATNVAKFLEIVKNPANHPVLVHCLAGKHRTGSMCAIFRMECNHWPETLAIKEMRIYGHDLLDVHVDLLHYLLRYQPTWLHESSEGKGSKLLPITSPLPTIPPIP